MSLLFLIGVYLIKFLNQKSIKKIKDKEIDDFFIWAILGVILGGRIGYVLFYQSIVFINNPLYILHIWKGGMSFHGGLFWNDAVYLSLQQAKIFKFFFN